MIIYAFSFIELRRCDCSYTETSAVSICNVVAEGRAGYRQIAQKINEQRTSISCLIAIKRDAIQIDSRFLQNKEGLFTKQARGHAAFTWA